MKRLGWITVLFLSLATLAYSGHVCGTAQMMDYLKNKNKTIKPLNVPKTAALSTGTACTASDLYDSVYTRTTKHFEIFYTLEGPHKTTKAYIDSLEKALEYAWDFHVNKSGMRSPKGYYETYHYEKPVQDGLYPVEVIDMSTLRNYRTFFREPCYYCFGLTIPMNEDESELLIENDFKHVPKGGAITDSVTFGDKTCPYSRANEDFTHPIYNYTYAKNFMAALRVTSIHELYHAIQFRYLNTSVNFWFEASASGVEEIAAPDVDDYFEHLSSMAENVGKPYPTLDKPYGAGILFLYLHNHVGHDVNRLIWENFNKEPNKNFQYQLTQVAKKKNLSADSLFHDFATKLVFTGKRSELVNSSFMIADDQSRWPEFKTEAQTKSFEAPTLSYIAYDYKTNGSPDMSKFKGRASAVAIYSDSYTIRFLPTTNSIDSAKTEFYGKGNPDSTLWVFSRFFEDEPIPTVFKDSTLRAYPTPWREGSLCFTPLPHNKDYIEIRNRRGNLITRIKYSTSTHCIDEREVKSLLVPGVYRFRIGNSGKLKDFIIVY